MGARLPGACAPLPVEGGLSRDPLIAATQINQAMEALVRECPAQYIWSYDRYKKPHGLDAPAPRNPHDAA